MSAVPTPTTGHRPRRRLPLARTTLAVLLLAAVVTVLLVAFHVFGSSTVVGSGVAGTQSRSLPAFRSVDVSGVSNLDVTIGTPQSVVVRADHNLLSRITTRVAAGQLTIGNRPGSYSVRTPVGVRVTVPSISALQLNGSGNITATGIHDRALDLSLAGVGTIEARGAVTRLHIDISGSGDAQLGRLIARDVTAVVDGDGRIALTATNRLDAVVSGTATIRYLGRPPHVVTHVSGYANITPG